MCVRFSMFSFHQFDIYYFTMFDFAVWFILNVIIYVMYDIWEWFILADYGSFFLTFGYGAVVLPNADYIDSSNINRKFTTHFYICSLVKVCLRMHLSFYIQIHFFNQVADSWKLIWKNRFSLRRASICCSQLQPKTIQQFSFE